MAFEGVEKCAVPSCMEPCSYRANLCHEHSVPGRVVRVGDGTGIVSLWYGEHGGKRGLIVIDDLHLGSMFGGAQEFSDKLRRQGFDRVQILRTPEEVASARVKVLTAFADWTAPWRPLYPWETGRAEEHESN